MDRQTRRAQARIFGKIEKQLNRKKYKCLAPRCKDYAIKSHSQQKEGQLRTIARNGQVYALERNFYKIFKKENKELSFLLMDIQKASAFPGFCSNHDNKLFNSIEKRVLCKDDSEQAYCFFLRAISYEYAQKRRAVESMKMFLHEAELEGILLKREYIKALIMGSEIFLNKDAPFYLSEVFHEDERPITEYLKWSWKIIPKCLGVSSTCCFSPLQSNHELYVGAHFNDVQPLVTFSLIPQKNETHIVLCWHSQHTSFVKTLQDRLDNNKNLEALINECAISESEDTCFNPDLWEKTSEENRLDTLNSIRHEFFRGKFEKIPRLIRI